MVIVEVTELPWLTDPLVEFKARLKSAATTVVIVTDTPAEVEVALLESPAYVAVMVCVPTLRLVVEKLAAPEASVPLPREVDPS